MASTIQIGALLTVNSPETSGNKAVRFPPLNIRDNGLVRLGGQGPCFRPTAIADTGKVRLGGQGPIFR